MTSKFFALFGICSRTATKIHGDFSSHNTTGVKITGNGQFPLDISPPIWTPRTFPLPVYFCTLCCQNVVNTYTVQQIRFNFFTLAVFFATLSYLLSYVLNIAILFQLTSYNDRLSIDCEKVADKLT